MTFNPGDRVRYVGDNLPHFKGKTGSVLADPSNGRYATTVKFDEEVRSEVFLTENLELISSAVEHETQPRVLPRTKDKESIAIAAGNNGEISISVLGHRSIHLDPENAVALADYIRRVTKHSVKKYADSL